jgi:putative lipoic acid-binding regulatory protein
MQADNDSLFEFPCDFPIKVMGKSHPEFAETIVTVVKQFDEAVDASRVETRPSSGGNYTGHPMVKVVL